jgi:hypothetical protein
MTTITLRRIKDDFIVTGPDIEPAKFKSRREPRGSEGGNEFEVIDGAGSQAGRSKGQPLLIRPAAEPAKAFSPAPRSRAKLLSLQRCLPPDDRAQHQRVITRRRRTQASSGKPRLNVEPRSWFLCRSYPTRQRGTRCQTQPH